VLPSMYVHVCTFDVSIVVHRYPRTAVVMSMGWPWRPVALASSAHLDCIKSSISRDTFFPDVSGDGCA